MNDIIVIWRPGECESQTWNLYVYVWNAITNDVDDIKMRLCCYDNIDIMKIIATVS